MRAIPNILQLLLIFSRLEQMSDAMFLELWGEKMSKNSEGYYLNNDYLTELCMSWILGQLSSSFCIVLTVKQIVSDFT